MNKADRWWEFLKSKSNSYTAWWRCRGCGFTLPTSVGDGPPTNATHRPYCPANKKEDQMDEMMDLKEAAAFLKVGQRTLEDAAREGQVPAARVGKLWRFSRTSLAQWPLAAWRAKS